MRIKTLEVCTPDGVAVTAEIMSTVNSVMVRVPKFGINYHVERAKYKPSIKLLEKYLEDLILKGMADEDIDTSIGVNFDPGGSKGKNLHRKVKRDKGKRRPSGIHLGTRGKKSAQGSGIGVSDSAMAKVRHSKIGGKDKSGN